MKIKTLELKNFRPYYGEIKVDFPTTANDSICLIHGLNGYGKTSLFLALNWCLYGHGKPKDTFEYFNTIAREEALPSMSVRIVFDDNGKEFSVLRRIQCNKPVTTVRDLPITELVIFEDGKKRQVQDDQILQELVNEKLPLEASQFSFFDGEKIEVYSSDDATEESKKAISSVLGLSLLMSAQEDLEKISVEIGRDRRRKLERAEEGKGLASEMLNLENDIEEAKKQKESLEIKYKSLQSQEFLIQEQLLSQEAAKSLISNINEIQEKIEAANKIKSDYEGDIKEATRSLYLDILGPVLENQLVENQRNRDRLLNIHLGAVREETAQNLIKTIEQTGLCICGRPADAKHIKAIRDVLELSDGKNINNSNSGELDKIKLLVTQLENALALYRGRASYAVLAAKLADKEMELDELETSQKSKKSQLGSIDQDTISSLTEALERTVKDKKQIDREIGALEKTILDQVAKRKKLENNISAISGLVNGLDLLNSQFQILKKSADAFGEIVQQSALAKQSEIQEASTHFFRNITNKAFGYERMIINDDFSFGVETSVKTRPPMALISAGEKQVTALSFILGLNEYTQRQAPIFIDTPMGRLDETHRRNVAKVLFELAQKGRQVILLVTDTDIAFGVYDILKPAVGAEFEIVHDQANLTSKLQRRKS